MLSNGQLSRTSKPSRVWNFGPVAKAFLVSMILSQLQKACQQIQNRICVVFHPLLCSFASLMYRLLQQHVAGPDSIDTPHLGDPFELSSRFSARYLSHYRRTLFQPPSLRIGNNSSFARHGCARMLMLHTSLYAGPLPLCMTLDLFSA